MREFIYTAVFFLMGLSLIVLLSFHRASATSSTQVEPLPTSNPQAVECFGDVNVNTNVTWEISLDCSDNKTQVTCTTSSHPAGGIIIGYDHQHEDGDWDSDPSDYCYAICSTTQAPQSNCKWSGAPT